MWLGLVDTETARESVREYDEQVDRVREQFAEVIATHSIAIAQYNQSGALASTATFITHQVATDLGIQIAEINGGSNDGGQTLETISKERYDVFDDADAMLVTTYPEVAADREDDSFWQRIRPSGGATSSTATAT